MKPKMEIANEHFPAYKGAKAPSWGMMAGCDYAHGLDGFIDGGRYAVVSYGPLLMAMSMQARPGDYFDINEELWHEFRYALDIHALDSCAVELKDMPKSFSWRLNNAPINISAKADLIDWEPDKGDPVMPIEEPDIRQHNISIQLLPYGFLAYRIAMFPFTTK